MHHNTVKDIRQYFIDEINNENYVTDKTGVKTVELVNACFIADEPTIFGEVNTDYIARELEWYKSMSLNVNDIPGGPPQIWKQVASPHGEINSNYGWCIYSGENGYQYSNVLEELEANPNSRRAVMIYTRPHMWYDYKFLGMNDFVCTNTVQYFIRNDKLIASVYMRSNDVVFGYRNDYAWQEYVALQLCDDLGVQLDHIMWHAGSLHVYERHFNLVK
jgi:thymidylate synthase